MPYLGFPAYVEKCREVVAGGYAGFALTGPGAAARVRAKGDRLASGALVGGSEERDTS